MKPVAVSAMGMNEGRRRRNEPVSVTQISLGSDERT